MLNLIRCVAICFVALFLSACTTIEAKRGFAVKTLGYEFTCAHEPSQTVIDGDVVKKLVEVAAGAQPNSEEYRLDSLPQDERDRIVKKLETLTSAVNNFTSALSTLRDDVLTTEELIEKCHELTKQKPRLWERKEKLWEQK